MNTMSRRSFLASAAGACALGACAAAPVALAEEGADAPAYDVAETRSYDLVIVGCGFSGSCAAMEASDTGKRIAVVEKNFAVGGNADYTEGVFGLNSKMMADAGIEVELDVPELVHNELTFTNWRTDGRVWYDVFKHSGEDIDWLAEHDIVFDKVDDYNGVSAVPCFHWWEGEPGASMGVNVAKFLETKDNVDVMLETKALGIKMRDGAVAGVYVETADGTTVELDAPAVIVTTGGFVDNHELIERLTGDVVSQSLGRGYDGSGHEMMVAAGAKESTASSVNNISVGSAEDHYFLALDDITFASAYQSILTVNESGERFVDENLFNEKFTVIWANAIKQQKAAYTFFDQNLIQTFESGTGAFNTYGPSKAGKLMPDLTAQLEEEAAKGNGVVFRGETVEELAEAAGMDPATLSGTVERYNGYCETGVDEEYGSQRPTMPFLGGAFRLGFASLAGFAFFVASMFMNGFACDVARGEGVPVVRTYAPIACVVYLMLGLGYHMKFAFFGESFGLTERLVVALVCLYIVTVAFALASRRDTREYDGPAAPAEEAQARPVDVARAVASLGDAYALTRRESQTLALLAEGRNVPFIAEELCLSADTVRTYIKSLHAKLGVHSRQDLISLVRAQREKGR